MPSCPSYSVCLVSLGHASEWFSPHDDLCAGRIATIPIASLPLGSLSSMDLYGGAIVPDSGPPTATAAAIRGGAAAVGGVVPGPHVPGGKAHKRSVGEAGLPGAAVGVVAAAAVPSGCSLPRSSRSAVPPAAAGRRPCHPQQRRGAAVSEGVPTRDVSARAADCGLLLKQVEPESDGGGLVPRQRSDDSSQLPWSGGWPACETGAAAMQFPSGGGSLTPVAWIQAATSARCDSDGLHDGGLSQPYAVIHQPPNQQLQQQIPYSENGLFVSVAAAADLASAASPDIYELLSEFGVASPCPSPGIDLGCSPLTWGCADDEGSGATGRGSRERGYSSSAGTGLVQWTAGNAHEGFKMPAAASAAAGEAEALGNAASHWATSPDEGAQSAMELFAHWVEEGDDEGLCGL